MSFTLIKHHISLEGLELDQAKLSTIHTLMPPITMKGVRSFLGHVGFYKRFLKDLSMIARHVYRLLEKDATFAFDEACLEAFQELKSRLVTAHIMIVPNWNKPFEIMCDANDFSIGAVLGQKHDRKVRVIYYAGRILNEA